MDGVSHEAVQQFKADLGDSSNNEKPEEGGVGSAARLLFRTESPREWVVDAVLCLHLILLSVTYDVVSLSLEADLRFQGLHFSGLVELWYDEKTAREIPQLHHSCL
jgi:hypothetical protein